jgi:hypothetical protein
LVGLGLRDLVVEFGDCELGQQISGLDVVPDVDIALGSHG